MAPPKTPSSNTLPSGGKTRFVRFEWRGLGGSAFGGVRLRLGAAALAEPSLVAPSLLDADTDPEVPAAWATALPATVKLKPQTTQHVSGLDIS